jgi:hypothetical protein
VKLRWRQWFWVLREHVPASGAVGTRLLAPRAHAVGVLAGATGRFYSKVGQCGSNGPDCSSGLGPVNFFKGFQRLSKYQTDSKL